MAKKKFFCWQIKLTLLSTLALIALTTSKGAAHLSLDNPKTVVDARPAVPSSVPQNSQPQPSTPPPIQFKRPPLSPRGAPGNRKGGGTRDGHSCSALEINERLLALVPVESEPEISNIWGLTVATSPVFWFYVPYLPKDIKAGELELWDETDRNPRNYQQIYQGTFTVTETPGIISLKLPATVKVESDKNYHWYLSLDINCNNQIQSVDVNGWIQRAKLNNISSVGQQSSQRERVMWYAENGIWYDAITELAQMQHSLQQADNFITDWQKLLRDAGLEELTNKPISNCCTLAP
ncbi:DUF928 domain-containing protein [Nostoc sp. FACHB-152]|uniref:DUF928 domain-containing protein n=1 Tax=unclassified Nostoc TaxID=2593658 RepID=UPI00168666FB|nr:MULTISPECIES: DUF928 domain-containing protein [unclassified Nostoc]MBD2449665.1 DUF928 domain-containing protein [Nostoc sp. FACHB-152]MBD2469671.1 DUF928 domain-containing protein [Nostoc sp. FACHB-145]